MSDSDADSLLCHRCGCDLHPGKGNFYVVRIEAFADPTPPTFTDSDLMDMTGAELDREINELIEDMKDISELELRQQVHRRLTMHLCGRCYCLWIENPAGE
jgi:hypothetical protein